MNDQQESRNLARAALRGEPSYIWRAGQARRLEMILQAAQGRELGKVLINGCGVGMYLEHLAARGGLAHGLDIDTEAPSPRYGSTPVDGPAQGLSIMKHWKWIVQSYYDAMGWDKHTGHPHEHTLRRLGLME